MLTLLLFLFDRSIDCNASSSSLVRFESEQLYRVYPKKKGAVRLSETSSQEEINLTKLCHLHSEKVTNKVD